MLAVASAAPFLSVLVWFDYSAILPLVDEPSVPPETT